MRFAKKVGYTLESSSIALDPTYDWDNTTTYARGDLVSYTDPITGASYFYLSNHDGNLNFTVDQVKHWTCVAPTNQWAMFSDYFDSFSEYSGGDLTVELQIDGSLDTITFTGVVASEINVYVYASEGGALLEQRQILVTDYLLPEAYLKTLTDEETYYNLFYYYLNTVRTDPFIVITFVPLSGLSVRCGKFFAGESYYVGETQHKATSKVSDYSGGTFNEFGVYEETVGAYSATIAGDVYIEDSTTDETFAKLKEVVSSPCLWDFNNVDTAHTALVAYGFLRVVETKFEATNATFIFLEVLTATSRRVNSVEVEQIAPALFYYRGYTSV